MNGKLVRAGTNKRDKIFLEGRFDGLLHAIRGMQKYGPYLSEEVEALLHEAYDKASQASRIHKGHNGIDAP